MRDGVIISYTRGNPAGRAKRCEWLLKQVFRRARATEAQMEGKPLADKLALWRRKRALEAHAPRIKALWACYTWLAEDSANG